VATPNDDKRTTELRKQFIADLDVETLGSGRIWRVGQSAALAELDSQQPQSSSANVAAASVAAFSDGVSGQQKEDLLNSTLLAQLSANNRYDREAATADWYDFYCTVLFRLGWISERMEHPIRVARPISVGGMPTIEHRGPLVGRRRGPDENSHLSPGRGRPDLPHRSQGLPFARATARRPRFTGRDAVVGLLQPGIADADLLTTQRSLDRLINLADRDRRVVIFETSSHSSATGNFQIESVSVTREGRLQMVLGAFFYQTTEPVARILSFNFPSAKTTMFQARDVMVLDETSYARMRDQVINQLGEQAAALIDDLQIS